MPTILDIVNMSLSRIGARSDLTTLTGTLPEQVAANLWYNQTREHVLTAAPWGFARKQATLTLLNEPALQSPWAYEYDYPNDALLLRYLGTGRVPYAIAHGASNRVILTDLVDATAVYTFNVTEIGLWPPAATDVLVNALAAALAIPLTGDTKRMSMLYQLANNSLLDARAREANEDLTVIDGVADWHAVRGVGASPANSITGGAYGPLFGV